MFQKQLLLEHAIRSLLAPNNERLAEQLATSFLEHGAWKHWKSPTDCRVVRL
jgi:hypothetical protein